MRTPEEVAREVLGNIAGPMRHIFGSSPAHHELLDALDVLVSQEIGNTEQLIRARDAEVRAETLAGFTEETRSRDDGYAGWTTGEGLIAKPATRERRLVGPWEPEP